MYIDVVPNRGSRPAVLLREGWREGGRVRKRTVANLFHWPPRQIETLRRLLRGQALVAPEDAFTIRRSQPHGHVAAVLGTLRHLGLDRLLATRRSAERDRVVALIAARVLEADSKLATARALSSESATSTLGTLLELGPVEADDLYAALDWLGARQEKVEQALARRHLRDGTLMPTPPTSRADTALWRRSALAEIAHPDFPGERLIACKNALLAAERARRREALLEATERELEKMAAATRREKRALRGRARIGVRVGRVLGRFKMAKHFELTITDTAFTYRRRQAAIDAEAALDGIYVLRTSVPREVLDAEDTVRTYKDLAKVERAFRYLKTVDLHVRPIHHRLAERVRAHVFLCMLAYYVEWHMRQRLAPLLFAEDDPAGAAARRGSPVRPAVPSPSAQAEAPTKQTARRRASPPLPRPPRAPGDPHPQHHPAGRRPARLRADERPDAAAAAGLQPAGRLAGPVACTQYGRAACTDFRKPDGDLRVGRL